MENLKYLKKIIDEELKLQNDKNSKRIKEAYGDDPPPILKFSKPRQFKEGEMLATPSLKNLFVELTADTGFEFHSAIVYSDHIALVGYRYPVISNREYIDPCIEINDFGILRARLKVNLDSENITKDENSEKWKLLDSLNYKLRIFIGERLSYEDEKLYVQDIKDYTMPDKTNKTEEWNGNYINLD